jgi:hypothetical protein
MRREVQQARYTGFAAEGRRLATSGKPRIRVGQAGWALRAAYRPALRAAVAASAAPYGYTLTIWTSGAVLSHARGIPSAADALLFLVGAVVAYALVGGLALGGIPERLAPEPGRAVIWGGLHLFSVGLAIGAATLVAHLVTNPAAWPLGGFLAAALYLIASAGQLAFAHTARRGNADNDDDGDSGAETSNSPGC